MFFLLFAELPLNGKIYICVHICFVKQGRFTIVDNFSKMLIKTAKMLITRLKLLKIQKTKK